MLGPPVNPPLLATMLVAVTTRAVRAISRKGSDIRRNDVGSRCYTDEMILKRFENPQRLHARHEPVGS